jgi:hypothetical protein
MIRRRLRPDADIADDLTGQRSPEDRAETAVISAQNTTMAKGEDEKQRFRTTLLRKIPI